jgi:glycosyltransferase involved in cell wall biosynthesis
MQAHAGDAVPANVDLVRMEPGAVRDLYAPSDIVCVSVFDNLGSYGSTTLLEGMAMEKAVIVSRTPGLADYIIEGETAISVPPSDAGAWTAAICRLRDDPALRERLGRNGRAWALQHVTIERWIEQVANALLIKEVHAQHVDFGERSAHVAS